MKFIRLELRHATVGANINDDDIIVSCAPYLRRWALGENYMHIIDEQLEVANLLAFQLWDESDESVMIAEGQFIDKRWQMTGSDGQVLRKLRQVLYGVES